MKKLHNVSRFILAACGLLVFGCYFLPLWEIKLWAPQYPEGLSIQIWHDNLTGDVDVINGLNHYIGMKHLKPEMFPEFHFLKYVIAAFIAFTLFTAWKGNLKWMKLYCLIILIGGVVALADFYRWGYDYGHHLNPDAPIKVPGMAYQPPVIGYKVLLNFTALSIPAMGGWIIVGLGVIAFAILAYEWRWAKTHLQFKAASVIAFLGLISLVSCNKVTPTITFGKDNCDYCKMTIMDKKFGAVIVTTKGRWYKFDDLSCESSFEEELETPIREIYVITYDKPGTLIERQTASYRQSGNIQSPMGGGIAAFSNTEACSKFQTELGGDCISSTELYAK